MAAPSVTCPPGQVPGGSGCDAAATRQRASGGVLAENPADAQQPAPTVDCDLHHTPVARSAAPGRYASEADTGSACQPFAPQRASSATPDVAIVYSREGHDH